VAGVVKDLLLVHYDPVYLQSMQRNFEHYGTARPLAPRDHSAAAMQALAYTLSGT
jgi:tRNA 2-selenouridine synthase